jgi:hypothetical protein
MLMCHQPTLLWLSPCICLSYKGVIQRLVRAKYSFNWKSTNKWEFTKPNQKRFGENNTANSQPTVKTNSIMPTIVSTPSLRGMVLHRTWSWPGMMYRGVSTPCLHNLGVRTLNVRWVVHHQREMVGNALFTALAVGTIVIKCKESRKVMEQFSSWKVVAWYLAYVCIVCVIHTMH